MGKINDLTGERFGRLTVIERAEDYRPRNNPDKKFLMWRCRCDCGTECIVFGQNLKSGSTQSCGCLRRDHSGRRGAAGAW